MAWIRRSAWQPAQKLAVGQIVLLDTIGELASVYSLASVAFVGGSLFPAGGHNPLEPAQFGVPIVMGPHYANFRAITDDLRAHDAIRITPRETLAQVLLDLLGKPAEATAVGARAKQIFDAQAGATARTVGAIEMLLLLRGSDTMRRPWLAPLVPLYAAGAALRARMQPMRQLGWPVITIGNLSTGGAGKTPLTIALAQLLTARGLHVDVLSRGYGRTSRKPARVRIDGTAAEFGDEPLLIARATGVPIYVAPQRYDAGLLAEADTAGQQTDPASRIARRAHILDDGFQHRQLARAVDILLLDRADWEDSLLPAGNLREPLRATLRATVIAIPAEDSTLEAELRSWGWNGPIWRLHRRMQVPDISNAAAAFCGIARP